jgi:hypothetical protein
VSSKSRTGALVAITKPMRDTFAPARSRETFLGCWPWEAGVSGFTPDIPGLKAVTDIICVRGYKSPLHPFLSPLSCPFRPAKLHNSFTPSLTPLGSKLVSFGGGFKRDWEQELGECLWADFPSVEHLVLRLVGTLRVCYTWSFELLAN